MWRKDPQAEIFRESTTTTPGKSIEVRIEFPWMIGISYWRHISNTVPKSFSLVQQKAKEARRRRNGWKGRLGPTQRRKSLETSIEDLLMNYFSDPIFTCDYFEGKAWTVSWRRKNALYYRIKQLRSCYQKKNTKKSIHYQETLLLTNHEAEILNDRVDKRYKILLV